MLAYRPSESAPPVVRWVDPPKAIGRKAQLKLQVEDPDVAVVDHLQEPVEAGPAGLAVGELDHQVVDGSGGLVVHPCRFLWFWRRLPPEIIPTRSEPGPRPSP